VQSAVGSPTPFTEHYDCPSEKILDEPRVVVLFKTNHHVLFVLVEGTLKRGEETVSTNLQSLE